MPADRYTDKANGVRIEGLSDFRRALKDVETDYPKELRRGLKSIADVVAEKSRSSFEAGRGPAKYVAKTVKSGATQSGATVSFGGTDAPFSWGVEFGGQRRKTTHQFQPWRGNGSQAGYHFYPEFRDQREHVVDAVGELLDDLHRNAFPNP